MSSNAIVESVRSRPTTWVSLANRSNRCTVYIGRAWDGYPASIWANPFKVQRDTPEERTRVLHQYADWLRTQPELLALLRGGALKGAVLGCWCAPKLCHGMLLAKLSDATMEQFFAWVNKGKEPLEVLPDATEITAPEGSVLVSNIVTDPKEDAASSTASLPSVRRRSTRKAKATVTAKASLS